MTAQIPLVGGNYYHIYNRGNNRKVGNLPQVANFLLLHGLQHPLRAHRPTHILRDDVLAWFGGRAPFIALHQTDPDERSIASTIME